MTPRTWTPPSKKSLTERRAEFVYDAARLHALHSLAPVVPPLWVDREEPFQEQFLRVIERQCGSDKFASPEAAHDSWVAKYVEMGWTLGPYDREQKTHPDLVPFAEMGELERNKDAVFLALCEIAERWILR